MNCRFDHKLLCGNCNRLGHKSRLCHQYSTLVVGDEVPAVGCNKGIFLTIEHLNAQSLLGNIDEIALLIKNRNSDILCVSETWLLPNLSDNLVNIPEYKIFRCDSGRGGGVCVYVKDVLITHVLCLDVPKLAGIEYVWVTVQCRKLQPSLSDVFSVTLNLPSPLLIKYRKFSELLV